MPVMKSQRSKVMHVLKIWQAIFEENDLAKWTSK